MMWDPRMSEASKFLRFYHVIRFLTNIYRETITRLVGHDCINLDKLGKNCGVKMLSATAFIKLFIAIESTHLKALDVANDIQECTEVGKRHQHDLNGY